MDCKKCILFVTNIPSPYQIDLFTEMQATWPDAFHVIFSAASERNRTFAFPKHLPFSFDLLQSSGRWWMKDWHRNRSLKATLSERDPRMIIIGGSYLMPDAREARRYALSRDIPWVYWGEDPFKKGSRGMRAMARKIYLRRFLDGASGAIGIGQAATDHYASLLPNHPVDNIPYGPALTGLLHPVPRVQESATRLRSRLLNGHEGVMVLFSGTLTARKAPDVLLNAFCRVAVNSPDSVLVFLGEGPLRPMLEEIARDRGLSNRVRFMGFLEGESLTEVYLAADVFVLPSRGHEGWGVVVQEAMAASLPVILSEHIGAAKELVRNGETGLLCAGDSVESLEGCLQQLCTDAALRTQLGAAARLRVMTTRAAAVAVRLAAFAATIERSCHD